MTKRTHTGQNSFLTGTNANKEHHPSQGGAFILKEGEDVTQDISIVRGTSNVFGLAITNPDGSPFMLEAGQVLVFAVKKRPTDTERLLVKKVIHSVDEGTYYLELFPSDTLSFEAGKYFYDVGLQQGGSVFFNVIEASVFDVKPNISQLGDGV